MFFVKTEYVSSVMTAIKKRLVYYNPTVIYEKNNSAFKLAISNFTLEKIDLFNESFFLSSDSVIDYCVSRFIMVGSRSSKDL